MKVQQFPSAGRFLILSFVVVFRISAALVGPVTEAEGMWCDTKYMRCEDTPPPTIHKLYWVHDDSQLVRVGKTLTGKEKISIRSRRTDRLEEFDCSSARELGCRDPLNLSRLSSDNLEENGVLAAFWQALTKLAAERPAVYEKYGQAIMHPKGNSRPLRDGVIELTDEGLRVRIIFEGWPKGDYPVDLCPVSDSGDESCPEDPHPVLYPWDPEHARPLSFPDQSPGLYRLHLCERDGGVYDCAGASALILAVPSSSFPNIRAAFQQALDGTAAWDKTDPSVAGLRRAYLQALAGK